MQSGDAMPVWSSIILVGNIHCGSCVSYILELLASYRHAIRDVHINIMTGQIEVVHSAVISTQDICEVLNNGAFEVHSATAKSGAGVEVTIHIKSNDDRADSSQGEDAFRLSTFEKGCLHFRGRQTHTEHCDACKKEFEQGDGAIAQPAPNNSSSIEAGTVEKMKSGASSRSRLKTEETLVEQDAEYDAEKGQDAQRADAWPTSRATLSIGGMTCASCSGAIDRALRELSFVTDVEVSSMTNSANILYKGHERIGQILEIIDELGYEAEIETNEILHALEAASANDAPTQRLVMLKIEGIYCKHCPPRIAEAIQRTYGSTIVVNQHASTADPVMQIKYTPTPPQVTIRSIVKTINDVDPAFKTTPYHPPSIEARSQRMQQRESRRLLLRIIFSFLVAIPTFLIGIVWMSLVPSNNSTRQYLEKPVWSGAVPRRDWALFIVATSVMFFAADVFHIRALKEIRSLWRKNSRVPILRRFYRFGSMNLLVSAGTSVAYFSSVAVLAVDATRKPEPMRHSQNYFDSVVFLTFFILIGRWLEVYSKAVTGNSISLLGQLKPEEAVLLTQNPVLESLSKSSSEIEDSEKKPLPRQDPTVIDANLLEVDDVVLVRHGASPPTDGAVTIGTTKFDESSLTGEARPVTKSIGDKVFAGSVNIGDAIQVKVAAVGGASMLDQIVSVVREGQTKRAPVERVVDVVTAYFVPSITALAICTWLIWLILGQSGALDKKYLASSQGGWAFWSLEFAIAVFVVACPCGIGLAAPTALFVGSGLAAKHGILVRGGGEAFQEASNVDAVVFDKTGTLTQGGDLQVTDHEVLIQSEEVDIAWAIIKALEEASTHPLARALHTFASSQQSDPSISTLSITEEAGKGLQGSFQCSNRIYEASLGSDSFISTLLSEPNYFASTILSKWQREAKSVAVLALRTSFPSPSSTWRPAALFAIADPIRSSTLPTLKALSARNIPTYMLTGDNSVTAAAVASTLAMPADHVFAGVLPAEKADKIRYLQETLPSRRQPSRLRKVFGKALTSSKEKGEVAKATVAFVGDGTNDAPALTAANVSIALSHPSASDIALTSASFIILSNHTTTATTAHAKRQISNPLAQRASEASSNGDADVASTDDHLYTLLTLLDLSSRVLKRVEFNFAWAGIYNALLVPVAAGVLFKVTQEGWRLGPVWASAAMAASSVSVVLSSLALRWEGRWRVLKR